jgi:hypothetical protein
MTNIRSVSIVSFVLFFIRFGSPSPASTDETQRWQLSPIAILLAAKVRHTMRQRRSLTRDRLSLSRCALRAKDFKVAAISYLTADFTVWAESKS